MFITCKIKKYPPASFTTGLLKGIALLFSGVHKLIRKVLSTLISSRTSVKKPTVIRYSIHPKLSKIEFCRIATRWCIANLGLPKSQAIPRVTLSYQRKQFRVLGIYSSAINTITIYIHHPAHKNLVELLDTIIHEYKHHLEITSRKQQLLYNKHEAEVGYHKNPFELSARQAGKAYRKKAFHDLLQQGHIVLVKMRTRQTTKHFAEAWQR